MIQGGWLEPIHFLQFFSSNEGANIPRDFKNDWHFIFICSTPFKCINMKNLITSLTIAGIFFSMVVTSCTKGDHPGHLGDDLPNKIIIDWNLVTLQVEGGPTYQH